MIFFLIIIALLVTKLVLVVRVTDDDVAGLVRLDHVATVELVYHCGSIQSPSIGTHYFMQGNRYLKLIGQLFNVKIHVKSKTSSASKKSVKEVAGFFVF